jgi:hypothetical protein
LIMSQPGPPGNGHGTPPSGNTKPPPPPPGTVVCAALRHTSHCDGVRHWPSRFLIRIRRSEFHIVTSSIHERNAHFVKRRSKREPPNQDEHNDIEIAEF